MSVVPAAWMPKCEMKNIVLHWTAGGYRASTHDRECYHILIEKDGTLVRGDHTIADNFFTGDDDYAAHTRGFNTKAIGVAVCCMADAREKPFTGGPCPMLEAQWNRMAEVAAELARRYAIPVTEQRILGHGEVQRVHKITQKGKWDPMVLPWERGLSFRQVGDRFRKQVAALM